MSDILYNCIKSNGMFKALIGHKKDLKTAAEKLLSNYSGQRVFAFYGKMGAGKTTFIQAICKALGSDDNVTSPTFALINEYKTRSQQSIFHFDFYRIKNLEEVFDMGYEDYFYSGEYCLIEWPELVEPLLPENIIRIYIEVNNDETRTIFARTE